MLPAYKNITVTHYTTKNGNTQILLYRRKPTKAQIERRNFFIKQRLFVLGTITTAIITPLLCGDGTASIFLLIVGIPLLFTKKRVMEF